MKKYESVVKRVNELEYKNGIVYAKVSGSLYKTLSVLYAILLFWSLIMNVFYVWGIKLHLGDTEMLSDTARKLETVLVLSGVMLVAFIIQKFGEYIFSFVGTAFSSIALIMLYAGELESSLGLWGYKKIFYWRHFLPLVFVVIFVLWMSVIAIRAKIKFNSLYKKVLFGIYEEYKKHIADDDFKDSEWVEFITNYDVEEYKKLLIEKDKEQE